MVRSTFLCLTSGLPGLIWGRDACGRDPLPQHLWPLVTQNPTDSIPPYRREQRNVFSEMPEVWRAPLPFPSGRAASALRNPFSCPVFHHDMPWGSVRRPSRGVEKSIPQAPDSIRRPGALDHASVDYWPFGPPSDFPSESGLGRLSSICRRYRFSRRVASRSNRR